MSNDLWTSSQLKAWDFVGFGFDLGLNQTQALTEYRAGGGAIRTSSWGELWHRYNAASSAWNTLSQYSASDTIPQSLFLDSNIKFSNEYTFCVQMNIRQLDGSILHDVFRYVGADSLITVSEMNNGINNAMADDLSNPALKVVEITSIEMYHRIG